MGEDKKKANLHEGHRQRMRARYLESQGEGFHSHELLEMLLFYGVPRQDTNALAHELINHFGSLEAVLTAPYDELIRIPGVKSNTAVLICLISNLMRRMAMEKEAPPAIYRRSEEIFSYVSSLYVGVNVERVYLLMFDNGMRMLGCVCLGEGTENCVNVIPRTVIREAITHRATAVILTHNHPDGVAVPSDDDRSCTYRLQRVLDEAGIQLIEHFVVAGNSVTPIMNHESVGSYGNTQEFVPAKELYEEYTDRCWDIDTDEAVWI